MPIDRPGEAYATLMRELQERLPDIARQIQEEVARGRRVDANSLAKSDQESRDSELRKAGGRLSKEDLLTVEFTDTERLTLLIDALQRLTYTMAAARSSIVELLDQQEVSPNSIRFRNEGDDEPTAIPVQDEEQQVSRQLADAAEALNDARSEFA